MAYPNGVSEFEISGSEMAFLAEVDLVEYLDQMERLSFGQSIGFFFGRRHWSTGGPNYEWRITCTIQLWP